VVRRQHTVAFQFRYGLGEQFAKMLFHCLFRFQGGGGIKRGVDSTEPAMSFKARTHALGRLTLR
jgi:hypothetical protein